MEIIKVTKENRMRWPSRFVAGRSRFLVGNWLAIREDGSVAEMGYTKKELLARLKGKE